MRRLAVLFLALAISGLLAAEDYQFQNGKHIAIGEALGKDEAGAVEAAKSAALTRLMNGLKKDGLFTEIFIKEPPLGLSFSVQSMLKEGLSVRASVQVSVDDESIRIIERGPYLQAAMAVLDGAEAALRDAETLVGSAETSETQALLGDALGRYGQALDRISAGLNLLSRLSSTSIYSSAGGRSLVDLKASLLSLKERSEKGLARIRVAEAALERDQAGRNLAEAVDLAIQEVEESESLLEEQKTVLSDPSGYPAERLIPVRNALSVRLSAMDDAEAALRRAAKTMGDPSEYLRDKLDYAKRRVDTAKKALSLAHSSLDREIRDPAPRRAARARFFRSLLLHTSQEYLQARIEIPLSLDLENGGLEPSADVAMRIRSEGAFGAGAGAWVRTGLQLDSESVGGNDIRRFSQEVDFGLWRRMLLWGGYSWDWARVNGEADVEKVRELRFGIGGVSSAALQRPRLDWLLGLSYELPAESPASFGDFWTWEYFNIGVDTLFRLGNAIVIEGDLFASPRDSGFQAQELLTGYTLRFGLRLPPPFLIGAALESSTSWPLQDGTRSKTGETRRRSLRFFLEYDL